MNGLPKGQAQVITSDAELVRAQTQRESAGPAGGLLIAVGTSLVLWAVLAQAVKLVSLYLF